MSADSRRRQIIGRALLLVVFLLSLYLVAPGLLALFGDLPKLRDVNPLWFVAVFVFESLAFVSIWELTRIALGTNRWFDVGCSQLAGNALSRALPGGAATGGTTQFQMLTRAGFAPARTTTVLTAVGILSTATLLVLPIFALPPIMLRIVVPQHQLLRGAILAAILGMFVLGGGVVLLVSDRVVRAVGALVDRVLRLVRRRNPPQRSVSEMVLEARDFVREALEENWKRALPAAFGNQVFDFLALLTCAYAVGGHPEPVLVLLAYVAAAALAMIPITPGGLGFVEAGLTGVLALSGLPGDLAVLTTLLYRLFSYWLPLPAGLVASALFARRHRNREHGAAAPLEPTPPTT
ncbi:MAG TPA: lysylphosphatidylglycerol synthase transmembrane domain-containing protein [Acidimicrobiia bacterium]|jgi:hypothetical protein